MANRYWVGGTGDISDNTNHWSDSSGGSPGASLPGSSDNIFFDSNSGSGNVTADTTMTVNDMDQTGASVSQFLKSGGGIVNVRGDAVVVGKSTATTLFWKFDTQAGQTSLLTYAGAGVGDDAIFGGPINVSSTGTVKLSGWAGGGILSTWTVTNGILDIDDETILLAGQFTVLSSGTLKFGSGGTINLQNNMTVNSSATVIKGTGVIQVNSNSKTLSLGGHDYYDLQLLSNNLIIDDCGASFDTVTLAAGNSYSFAVCDISTPTITADTLSAPGTSGSPINMSRNGGSGSQQWSMNVPDFNFDYGTITNGNSSTSVQVPNATDGGNNTNFQFGGGTREDYQRGAIIAFAEL